VQLAQKVVDQAPTAWAAWNTLGVARYRAGEWKRAIEALEKSRQLRQGGDSYDYFFLAMAHWQLGEKEQARQDFDKAVRWMDQHRPRDEDLRYFRTEAAELLGVKEQPMGR
jgi:uncharacterized protein HemY